MNANLVSVWREAWRPPDRRPPWAWAEQHIGSIPYSPIPGRFRSDNSPQIREPLEALIDPRVRLVFIIAAIQSGKTSVGELGLCHIIASLPGPTLWLDQTDDDAKDQAESRLHKLFEDCALVKALFPTDRHKKRITTIHFVVRRLRSRICGVRTLPKPLVGSFGSNASRSRHGIPKAMTPRVSCEA